LKPAKLSGTVETDLDKVMGTSASAIPGQGKGSLQRALVVLLALRTNPLPPGGRDEGRGRHHHLLL
jgi:hypothetical protein